MARPPRSKSRLPSLPGTSLFENLGRDLEIEARMIIAWLRGLLKMGLETVLRFGLRSDNAATIMERSPGHSPGFLSPRSEPHDHPNRKPASPIPAPIYAARRMPKRFLAARHGDE